MGGDDFASVDNPLGLNPPAKLVTLRLMSYNEAQLAKIKLESEGILVFIYDQEVAIANPLVFSSVKLKVRDVDVQRANQILSTPAPDTAEGEYANENWRCPKCHRKTVELLPLSTGWQLVKYTTIFLFTFFILVLAAQFVLPGDAKDYLDQLDWLFCPLMLFEGGMFISLMFAKRDKRCETCGHVWAHGQSSDDSD